MNRLLGYSLMGVGLLGLFFFLNYKGTTIPVKELWFVLSIFTLIGGSYLLAKHKLQKLGTQRDNSNSERLAEIERLKRIGDKVRVTLDNSEIKSRSYQHEIISGGVPSRSEMLDVLYDGNRNYKTQEVKQTYIVFHKTYKDRSYKFVSHAMTQDAEVVKRYRQKGIDLYINPKDPSSYYFDMPYV